MQKALWWFLILAFVNVSCREKKHQVSVGAYFWERVFEPSSSVLGFLEEKKIDTLHLRYFDLDYDASQHRAFPVAPIIFKVKPTQNIIPVVFIKNVVFEKTEPDKIVELASNVLNLINSINQKNNFRINEIQLDCDWTVRTSRTYFEFLEAIKKASKLTISATIRLHQIKFYEKTGVPPINKGTLMLYNTGNWKAQNTENSLFDAKEIIKYLDNLPQYPLKLSFAFPIISQKLWYRKGVFKGFINNIDSTLLMNQAVFKTSGNIYLCQRTQNLDKVTLRAGDVIRIEKAEVGEIMKIKKLIFEKIGYSEIKLLLFQLNETNIRAYSKPQLNAILDSEK